MYLTEQQRLKITSADELRAQLLRLERRSKALKNDINRSQYLLTTLCTDDARRAIAHAISQKQLRLNRTREKLANVQRARAL